MADRIAAVLTTETRHQVLAIKIDRWRFTPTPVGDQIQDQTDEWASRANATIVGPIKPEGGLLETADVDEFVQLVSVEIRL